MSAEFRPRHLQILTKYQYYKSKISYLIFKLKISYRTYKPPLCFHGGDYAQCRLLGYKNTDRTLQQAHYISATVPSPLMLCKI
jgi:hypothetical protein